MGKSALDAIESGIRECESDPNVTSVGYGGFPDRDGCVTLDACIQDHLGNAGSVACLQEIMHPISVARMVMEKTAHVMLVDAGAQKFALDNGMKKENLLTPNAKTEWEKWMNNNHYVPQKWNGNHDTVGTVILDKTGNITGGCSTSGMAWKLHGRVGDSPIIGAGLFVDNEVGGAAATGVGETVIRVAGSAMVVELMRNGKDPKTACRIVLERLVKQNTTKKDLQVAFIAVNKAGDTGAYSIQPGFKYAVCRNGEHKLLDSESLLK